jgi:hypothetical protein
MTTPTLKTGKLPARTGAVKFAFGDFLHRAAAPVVPETFGHELAVGEWGMLGNDRVGNCVIAGGEHETMLWCSESKRSCPRFTDRTAIRDYSRIAGYVAGDPSTDQGTDMELAAKYRRKTGLRDTRGRLHKIGAYLALRPGDLAEHLLAAYMFGAVGVGFLFPEYAMGQFNAGQPWDAQGGPMPNDGHYVPLVAKRDGNLVVVTWGKTQVVTPAFFAKYNDESVVYLSEEMLSHHRSPEGFALAELRQEIAAL